MQSTTIKKLMNEHVKRSLWRDVISYLRFAFTKGTFVTKDNLKAAVLVGTVGHPLFAILHLYVFKMPWDTIPLKTGAGLVCLLLATKDHWSPFFKKFFSVYWHFMLIYNLPFLITLTALNNNMIKTWPMWELIMLYILIMYVPHWLVFLFDLAIGVGLAFLIHNAVSITFYVPDVVQNPNLDLIPAHIDLVGAELEMINMPNREHRLKMALDKIKDNYDFIIIDCSPSLGLITVNALTAADSVIIPVQCEYFALEGLGKLLNTIKIVQGRLNEELDIEGIVLTMYDTRLRLANQVVDEVKTHFQELVFDTIIHRNTRLSEAPSFGETIIMHDATCKGAINYLNFAREVLQKNDLTKMKNKDKQLSN